MPHKVTNRFIFPGSSQSLVTALRQILDFIVVNLPYINNAANANFKIKAVVTELLNNAIKHNGKTDTIFDVFVDENNVLIEKIDEGPRFDPNGIFSSSNEAVKGPIKLSSDLLHHLYAVATTDSLLKFFCEEIPAEAVVDVNSVGEHFGLLIITKSADEFLYYYHAPTGTNKFSVSINLA